jgi:hypothetical protein
VSKVASLALERFNVDDKILHAHAAQVLIGPDLMKDRAPDRHLVGAVCGWSLRTFEYVADAVAGKPPSGVLGEQGEVGHFGVESRGRRTVSLPVESVTRVRSRRGKWHGHPRFRGAGSSFPGPGNAAPEKKLLPTGWRHKTENEGAREGYHGLSCGYGTAKRRMCRIRSYSWFPSVHS